MTPEVEAAVTRAHHQEWARVVATLTRRFGDLGVAEDAAAEAFAAAVERWPRDGVPTTPGAWLTTTATRKALDRVRRESHRDAKHEEARLLFDDDERAPLGAVDDDRLRLVFTCCHPALSPDARVALTLRMLGGLTVPEIARAFLVQETTTGSQRAGARGVRAGDRAGGQHGGGGAPDPAARPAGPRRAPALTRGRRHYRRVGRGRTARRRAWHARPRRPRDTHLALT